MGPNYEVAKNEGQTNEDSIHDELALFVKAGLTPMEALQTATRNPAEFLGLLDSLGAIEQGKAARQS